MPAKISTKSTKKPVVPEPVPAKKAESSVRPVRRLGRPGSSETQPIVQGLGLDPASIKNDIFRYLSYTLGRDAHALSDNYRYQSTVFAVRDRLMERWKATQAAYYQADCKRGYYLSLEFLMGRALGNAALNLGLESAVSEALLQLGMDWEQVQQQEPDAGLGNGGLGRLAACFLDSCATLQMPVLGYGIRYDYGMFRQRITANEQHEEPDDWLSAGYPWELVRPEYIRRVKFGGKTEFYRDEGDRLRVRWVGTGDVLAVPYDMPVPGYQNGTVNTLRMWRATATQDFDLTSFNAGDYEAAVQARSNAENISRVLYPNDKSENGKELRLKQQYFLASASLQDAMRRWVVAHGEDFANYAEKNVFQLNDTHPTVSIAEMMRLLIDEHGLGWDDAWSITTRTMAYTNHTLLPEALERWSVALFRKLLPRILEIIFEVNARHLRAVANRWPGDTVRLSKLSIIEEGPHPMVRMANLAIVGSFSVNGVAALHSDLLKKDLFHDFAELWPERFNNKTNGVTQRRWMAMCNPGLAELITGRIGDGWITELSQLAKLKTATKDKAFKAAWFQVKQTNKAELAAIVESATGVKFLPTMLFDIQVKRIHEYKRQLLNALHVVHLYDRIKRRDTKDWTPRAVLFGGKAAPGYAMAKSIIRFICHLAEVVNSDPDTAGLLRVAFLPDYRVSLMEAICPAADLSEQISTAGKEASGTGNMKFMMNGALTIGTLDGANIEIREECGNDHFFLFGKTTEEIAALRPTYSPAAAIAGDENLKRVLDLISTGHFNPCNPGIFDDILKSLTAWGDYWFTLADFSSYVEAQRAAATRYRDQDAWTVSSIINTATSGKFSSDRTISEYNRDIWKLTPVKPLPVTAE